MLGKLLKYDNREMGIPVLLFSLISVAAGFLGGWLARFLGMLNEKGLEATMQVIISIPMMLTISVCFAAIFAAVIIALVIILRRYYKNLFSDEGYLTFTLPVEPSQLLFSKTLLGYFWLLIATIASCLGFIVFLGTVSAKDTFFDFTFTRDILSSLGYSYTTLTKTPIAVAVIEIVLSVLVALARTLLSMYLAITVGAIVAKKHKILAAIGIYVLINMATSVISNIFSVIIMRTTFIDIMENDYQIIVHGSTIFQIILNLAIAVVCYLINRYLLTKKVNI